MGADAGKEESSRDECPDRGSPPLREPLPPETVARPLPEVAAGVVPAAGPLVAVILDGESSAQPVSKPAASTDAERG